jgi:hypothetical protein
MRSMDEAYIHVKDLPQTNECAIQCKLTSIYNLAKSITDLSLALIISKNSQTILNTAKSITDLSLAIVISKNSQTKLWTQNMSLPKGIPSRFVLTCCLRDPPQKQISKTALYKQVYRFSTDAACSPISSLSGHKPRLLQKSKSKANKEKIKPKTTFPLILSEPKVKPQKL